MSSLEGDETELSLTLSYLDREIAQQIAMPVTSLTATRLKAQSANGNHKLSLRPDGSGTVTVQTRNARYGYYVFCQAN